MDIVSLNNVWIALANVEKRKGFEHLLKGYGAYVNIVVKANNIEDLEKLVQKTFYEEGFVLVDLQDIEYLSDRLKKFEVDEDVLKLVENLSNIYPVQFDTFHTYPFKDA